MSETTDAILFYGYNLGSDEEGWRIEEVDKDGWLQSDWYTPYGDTDFPEEAAKRLQTGTGVAGVEVDFHCSSDYPMYFLSAHTVTAHRGSAIALDPTVLETQRVAEDWDGKLVAALAVMGMTPKERDPRWLIVSYWGC